MKNAKLRMVRLSAGLFTLAATTTALAQVEAEGQVGMGLPGATPATTAAAAPAAGGSDHDMMVGRMAVGYLGRSSIQVGAGAGSVELQAPVVGVRYWMDPGLGLDVGLGLALQGGSTETDDVEVDAPSFFGLVLHAGVPLALSTGRHYVFEVIPEANVGFGSGSLDATDHSGFLVDVGVRAGAEVHFGFIGLPELSLQASVGALFGLQSASTTVDTPAGETETSVSGYAFRTTVNNSPWSIFTSNVAAFYYF